MFVHSSGSNLQQMWFIWWDKLTVSLTFSVNHWWKQLFYWQSALLRRMRIFPVFKHLFPLFPSFWYSSVDFIFRLSINPFVNIIRQTSISVVFTKQMEFGSVEISITVPFQWEKYPAPQECSGKFPSMENFSVDDGRELFLLPGVNHSWCSQLLWLGAQMKIFPTAEKSKYLQCWSLVTSSRVHTKSVNSNVPHLGISTSLWYYVPIKLLLVN